MRTVCLALLGCAALASACKIDNKAFERNEPEGVSSKDKQENGGADLVRPDRSARATPEAAGGMAPAADSGMEQPPPVAAEPPDSGPPPEVPDAASAEPNPGPQGVAADSGNPASPDDDAGPAEPPAEPAPESPPTCTTHDCYCETMCKRGTALACPEEPSLADCIAACRLQIKPGCEAQALAVARCKAELPADKYICDEDLLTFIVLGCQVEDQALYSCRSR